MINVIKYHKVIPIDKDISTAIARHSADRTVFYKTVNGEALHLAYFLPKDMKSRNSRPALCMIHGGGWKNRKIFEEQPCWMGDYLGFLARYYADHGIVCVSIDYRLLREQGQVPGYGLPELSEDCADAVAYVIDHALDYGIDQNAIYLLGESAGGYLAAAVATSSAKVSGYIKKLILVNAITDLRLEGWSGFLPDGCDPESLSPAVRVGKNTPETVLLHGLNDKVVPLEHSCSFYRQMESVGRPCTLHLLDSTSHAFLLAEYYPDGTEQCKIAMDIIEGVLDEKE